jgi:hypothetical protein
VSEIGDEDIRLLANCLSGDIRLYDEVHAQCNGGNPCEDPTSAAVAAFIASRASAADIDHVLHQLRGATIMHGGGARAASQLCLTMPVWLHAEAFAASIATTEVAMVNVILHAKTNLKLAFPFIDTASATVLKQLEYAWKRGCSVQVLCRDASSLDGLGLDHQFISALRTGRSGASCRVPTSVDNVRWTFHAKVMLADEVTAYLGSANLTKASLASQAEVGILISDAAILRDLRNWYSLLWSALAQVGG